MKLAPALPAVATSTARTSMPCLLGRLRASGRPPRPAGSVNDDPRRARQVGGRLDVAAEDLLDATRAWYLPMWVSSERPLTSPIA